MKFKSGTFSIHEHDDLNGGTYTSLRHDCSTVGNVEMSEDWLFCPWCGVGMTRKRTRLNTLYARFLALPEATRQMLYGEKETTNDFR